MPQGSILGPTLFLTYINNLCDLSLENGIIITYADDIALFFTADTWSEVFLYAQAGLNKVMFWLNSNILTLNIDKTKHISFSLRTQD